MNTLIVSALVVLCGVCVLGQKPFYAQGGSTVQLGYRFRDRTSTDNVDIGNRIDAGPTTTIRLPVDALGDVELVNRISKWPREKQPFWYLNWQQIEEHRNRQPDSQEQSQPPVFVRGSFQGP